MQLEAPQMFDELLQEIHLFSDGTGFSDDVCLVGVDYRGPTESPTRLKI